MRLWHTTLKANMPSINKYGVCVRFSQGARQRVWLHSEGRQAWAFLHTIRKHGGDVRDVVSILVEVPDDVVRNSAAPGLYYSEQDVSPSQFVRIVAFQEVSRSPLQGGLKLG